MFVIFFSVSNIKQNFQAIDHVTDDKPLTNG